MALNRLKRAPAPQPAVDRLAKAADDWNRAVMKERELDLVLSDAIRDADLEPLLTRRVIAAIVGQPVRTMTYRYLSDRPALRGRPPAGSWTLS